MARKMNSTNRLTDSDLFVAGLMITTVFGILFLALQMHYGFPAF